MSQKSVLEKHKPGTYLATVVDWGVSKTQAGAPQVCVCFRYENGDLLWFGSFKDTVVERTVDTLVALGLNGPLESLADGKEGKALNMEKEMEIVVEHRKDQKGELRVGIAWVNDPNRTRISNNISKAEASQLFMGANAVLMRKRQGQPTYQAPSQRMAHEPDLPF